MNPHWVYVEKPNEVVLEKKIISKTKVESDELRQNNYLVRALFFAGQAGWVRRIVITSGPHVVCVNNMDKLGWVIESPMN